MKAKQSPFGHRCTCLHTDPHRTTRARGLGVPEALADREAAGTGTTSGVGARLPGGEHTLRRGGDGAVPRPARPVPRLLCCYRASLGSGKPGAGPERGPAGPVTWAEQRALGRSRQPSGGRRARTVLRRSGPEKVLGRMGGSNTACLFILLLRTFLLHSL